MFMPLMRRVVPALMVLVALLLIAAWSAHPVNADSPFGNDGNLCHGANQESCRPDPQPSHGQECEVHGNNPDGNDDHCASPSESASSTETAQPTPTPDVLESMPTCSEDCEPTQSESPSTQPSNEATQEPTQTLAPNAYPDGAGQPPLPNTAMQSPSQTGWLLILVGIILMANGAFLLIRLWVTRKDNK